jgi:hypothetical protein
MADSRSAIATDSPFTHLNQQQTTTIHQLSLTAETSSFRAKQHIPGLPPGTRS